MSETPNNRFTQDEVKTLLEDIRSEWRPVIEGWGSLVSKVDGIAVSVSKHEERLFNIETSNRLLHREMKEVKTELKELTNRVGALETRFV